MDQRLNGINPLAYMGVNPYTPVALITRKFDPTPQDWQNILLATVWLNTETEDVFILVSLARNIATWVKFASGGSNPVTSFVTDTGTGAIPSSGVINDFGDSSFITTDSSGNTITTSLVNGPSAGQVIISGTSAPAWAGLTAGSGISITPGNQSITIAATSPQLNWVDVTGVTQAIAANTGYTANNSGLVTFTLPSTAAYGSLVWIVYKGTGGWQVNQNSGQTIHFGITNTTTGAGGSLASSQVGDVIEILCTTANTDWRVINSVGNITVV